MAKSRERIHPVSVPHLRHRFPQVHGRIWLRRVEGGEARHPPGL